MAFIKRKKEQMHQNNIVYKKNRLQSILLSQDGMGVVEVILIIVVLIGLVIIFQTNIDRKSTRLNSSHPSSSRMPSSA